MAQMGTCGLLPSPPAAASLPLLLLLPSFPCSPSSPIPFLISLLPLCIPIHGSAWDLSSSWSSVSPHCLLRELLHGIDFFFPHLSRSLADGWSRRSLHEEPAHLLPAESTPVNPRTVSRSWNSQPLKHFKFLVCWQLLSITFNPGRE